MVVNYMLGLFRSNSNRIGVFLDGKYGSSTGMGRTTLMLCDSMLRADPDLDIVLASSMEPREALALIDEKFRSRMRFCSLMWAEGSDTHGVRWLRPQTVEGKGFLDCKIWFFFNLPAGGIVAPIRPAVMFCADLLVRVVPHAYHDDDMLDGSTRWQDYLYHLLSYRQASLVYATSPRTLRDVISFAGVEQLKTCLAPQFPPVNEEIEDTSADVPFDEYFLWTSNDTPHKNHARAFEVLNRYYLNMGDKALPVVMTGPGTRWFSPENPESSHPYHAKIRSYISDKPHLTRNVYFPETLDRSRFIAALKHASFLWHNVLYDNGTAAVLEAAEYHVPSLVSDYPQMRFFAEKYRVDVDYFNAFNIDDGVLALEKMTAECSIKRLSVDIDYTDENNRFRKWIRELLAATFASPKAPNASALLTNPRVDEQIIYNAVKIWPPLSSYLESFPWQDVPVVGMIIAEDDRDNITNYISLFHTLLREKFLDFKLLLLLPCSDGALATARSYILKESLAFDFIYAGDASHEGALEVIRKLATYTFCDIGYASTHRKDKDWPVELLSFAGSSNELAKKVAEIIERVSGGMVEKGSPVELHFASRPVTFVPELAPPPRSIDFSNGAYERYLISGFHQMEDGFRWVTSNARCLLGNFPGDYFFKKQIKKIGRFWKKPNYLHIDLELETLGFESADGRPTLNVCVNRRKIRAVELERGRMEYIVPISNWTMNFKQFVEVELSTNFEYKAGGEGSLDNRIISWKLFSISLESRN